LVFHPADGEVREISVPDQKLYIGEGDDMHAAILDGARNYLTSAIGRGRGVYRTAIFMSHGAAT